MKQKQLALLFILAQSLLASCATAEKRLLVALPDDPVGKSMIHEAQQRIQTYHADAPPVPGGNNIRFVYFHGKDQAPLADWDPRMQRTIADVRDFYAEGLERLGVKSDGLPFERKGDRFVFHVVKGAKPATKYTHESGNEIAAELRKALAGTVDFSREHVLVIHGLCQEEPSGRFVFHAPYYGGGDHRRGLCHAADCRLLDPQLLDDTKNKIVYAEHYYARKEQTVALFNTWYLGGIAHELGHGIDLPHNNGTPLEKTWNGTSLMGWGNHHYRSDRWGGKKPSFLSQSCVLRLISSPLITQSNKGRWGNAMGKIEAAELSHDGPKMSLKGRASGVIPAYAVIVYVWRYRSYPDNPGTDHGATTLPALVDADGNFTISDFTLPKGEYKFKITALHLSGAATTHRSHLSIGGNGAPDVDRFQKSFASDRRH